MHEPITSATAPSGRRRYKLLASGLALSIAAFGSIAAVTAGAAVAASTFPPVTTQNYTIGTTSSAVSSVTAAVSPTSPNASANFSVKFTTPAALTVGSSASDIYINTGDTSFPAVTSVDVADLNTGFASAETASTSGGLITIVLSTGSGSINAGDTILVSFVANTTSMTTTTNLTFAVSTSASGQTNTSSANTITITPAVTAPKATQSSQVLGAGASYGLSGFSVLTGTSDTTDSATLTLYACQAAALTGTGQSLANPCGTSAAGGITWSTAPGSYSVTQYTSSGTATAAISVSSVAAATPDGVTLTLAGGTYANGTSGVLSGGDSLTVTGTGTNPTTSQSDIFVGEQNNPASGSPYYEGSGNQVSFGGQITGLAVTPTPATAGSTATYMLGFNVSSTGALNPGGSINIVAPKGIAFTSNVGAVITDTTTGVSQVVAPANNGLTTTNNTDDTLVLPVNIAIADGNAVTVTLFNVTNPPAGSYGGTSGFTVSTSQDIIIANNATAFVITPATVSTMSPTVTVSDTATGALANYTIASFKAASNLVGGTDTIEVKAPGGTLLPSSATLTDATTSAGTQTINASTGAGTNDATYKLAANVTSGDLLSLSLTNVVNPGTASSTYSITLGADNATTNATVAGTQGLAAIAPVFPTAATSGNYPDGAIVNFGGTFYVFAGGHAFGIPSIAALKGIQAVDPATVMAAATGAAVPTTAPAVGTTIVAYNNPTIYVVGTDGQLHGFATPAQFLGDGYDAAVVITVPGTGGLTVGATAGSLGASGNAAATMADGAIINDSGTFYVYAGGKAFGIPGPIALQTVLAGNFSTPITGTVSSSATSATPMNGTLVTYKSAVYVVNNSNLYEFKGMKQLMDAGYGGTPSIIIPNVGGLSLVTTYTGA